MGTYSDPRKNQKKSITNNKAQTKKKNFTYVKKLILVCLTLLMTTNHNPTIHFTPQTGQLSAPCRQNSNLCQFGIGIKNTIGRFYTEDALSVFTNSSGYAQLIKHLDELSLAGRCSRRVSKDISSRSIIRLVSVFILETHNQANYKCMPSLVQRTNYPCGRMMHTLV